MNNKRLNDFIKTIEVCIERDISLDLSREELKELKSHLEEKKHE